jgi:hypothetical protein
MSITVTVTIPDTLKKPICELEQYLDQIDPPKNKGAPRKVSNHDVAVNLIFMAANGFSWRKMGTNYDAIRKRFSKLSKNKAFESFFLQVYPKAKTLWEDQGIKKPDN